LFPKYLLSEVIRISQVFLNIKLLECFKFFCFIITKIINFHNTDFNYLKHNFFIERKLKIIVTSRIDSFKHCNTMLDYGQARQQEISFLFLNQVCFIESKNIK